MSNAATKKGDSLINGSKRASEAGIGSLGRGNFWYNNQVLLDHIGAFKAGRPTIWDLRRMRTDGTLKMVLHFTKTMILRADYTINCDDAAIQAAATENAESIHDSWMRTGLNCLDFGFQGGIKQFRFGQLHGTFGDDNRSVWDDPVVQPVLMAAPIPIPPELARVVVSKSGQMLGINANGAPFNEPTFAVGDDDQPVEIPADWALWFVNEFEEEFGNWYGNSRIASAYEDWHAYWFTHHMRNRNVEQDGDPALQVWYPKGSDPTGEIDGNGNAVMRDRRDIALMIGDQLRGGATIAWPSDVHMDDQGRMTPIRLWEADYLKGGDNTSSLTAVLEDLRMSKMRSALMPEDVLTEALNGTSSRATSGNRIGVFMESLETIADQMDHIFNEQQLDPFVRANWGDNAPKARRVTTGFREEDLSLLTELLKMAFNLDPNALPLDFEEMTRRSGIPMLSADEQKEREEAVKAQQEQQQASTALQGGASPDAQQLSMSQERTKPRKYEREVINLDQHGPAVEAPKRDHTEKEELFLATMAALEAQTIDVVAQLYRNAIQEAVAVIERGPVDSMDLSLALGDSFFQRIAGHVLKAFKAGFNVLADVLASMKHAVGLAHLQQINQPLGSWGIESPIVQGWAKEHADELTDSLANSLIEQLRPSVMRALTRHQEGVVDRETGMAANYRETAAELAAEWEDTPLWMAKRFVRTESRLVYNQTGFDVWERVGISELMAHDAFGGESGTTDAVCIARNGQIYSIPQAIEENHKEHPNGTLFFSPILPDVLEPMLGLSQEQEWTGHVHQMDSIWAVDRQGRVLSPIEVGRALA